MKVVLATKNEGKLREFKQSFQELGWELVSLDQVAEISDIIEDGTTFCENAIIKAKTVMQATGLPTIADDSGIVVDALNGKPGVYSARYAGAGATDEDNNKKLLEELADVPKELRTARFVCCLAYYNPNEKTPLTFEGECQGIIIDSPRGTNGFGYDPLFFVESENKTMAEIPVEQKNKISHRAKALNGMKNMLSNY